MLHKSIKSGVIHRQVAFSSMGCVDFVTGKHCPYFIFTNFSKLGRSSSRCMVLPSLRQFDGGYSFPAYMLTAMITITVATFD